MHQIYFILLFTFTKVISKSTAQNCTYAGQIIPDPNLCDSFFICVETPCGDLSKNGIVCPYQTTFDPAKLMCTSAKVDCVGNPAPIPPACKPGDLTLPDPLDPTRYYFCAPQAVNITLKRHFGCMRGLVYNSTVGFCKMDDSCYIPPKSCGSPDCNPPEINPSCLDGSTLENQPLYYNSECQKPGQFPDALECNRYYLCTMDECGKLNKMVAVCQLTSKYDPIKGICTNDPVKCLCTTKATHFKCPRVGLYPDRHCPSQYYSCVNIAQITYEPKRIYCLGGLIYDKDKQSCTNETTVTVPQCANTSEPYYGLNHLCKDGINVFGVADDCYSYYICFNGELIKGQCRDGKVFDRKKKKCSHKHKEIILS